MIFANYTFFYVKDGLSHIYLLHLGYFCFWNGFCFLSFINLETHSIKGHPMIVQPTKETKTQTSLIELLGGTQKKNTTKSTDTFSKLLISMAEGLKADKSNPKTDKGNGANVTTDVSKIVTASSTKADTTKISTAKVDASKISTTKADAIKTFNAVIDPKKSEQKSSLQKLLSGEDQPQNSNQDHTIFTATLLDPLSNDQVRSMINRAKDYLKNEITSKSPEYKADPKTLPKTLMGLVQLADKLGLNPQSITLSTLITEPAEQAKFAPTLLAQPLFNAKALAMAPAQTISTPAVEEITQLLNVVKSKDTSPKAESKNDSRKNDSFKKDPDHKQPLSSLLQALDKSVEVATVDTSAKDAVVKPVEVKAPLSPKVENLISLLQGEPKKEEAVQSTSSTKQEGDTPKIHQAPKADALEVKAKEAAQSMRFFASDLKEAVDSYKPPFTRLSMTLNPEKLGEVEVTLVQRGNNVHVNIQSANSNSVAFLAHNAMELKTQLANQGIANATMNFMSGGDGQTQNQGQQQQQQQQNRFRAYESLKEIDMNGEQLSALEIIIPHYA